MFWRPPLWTNLWLRRTCRRVASCESGFCASAALVPGVGKRWPVCKQRAPRKLASHRDSIPRRFWAGGARYRGQTAASAPAGSPLWARVALWPVPFQSSALPYLAAEEEAPGEGRRPGLPGGTSGPAKEGACLHSVLSGESLSSLSEIARRGPRSSERTTNS
ncbi:unnamed protein product [Ixodes pacificus]